MKYQVKIAEQALQEYEIGVAWWHVHRERTPSLLETEFLEAVGILSVQPEIGVLSSDNADVRRVLLRKSRYSIYYRVNRLEQQVEILSFWHNSREQPPI